MAAAHTAIGALAPFSGRMIGPAEYDRSLLYTYTGATFVLSCISGHGWMHGKFAMAKALCSFELPDQLFGMSGQMTETANADQQSSLTAPFVR
jgi:hypothetical protein